MIEEKDIKYVLNTELLQKGDILLINTYEERWQRALNSPYTHAALYMGDAFIIESDGLGVDIHHVFSFGFKCPEDVKVLRNPSLTAELSNKLLYNARILLGMEYGTRQLRHVPEFKLTPERDYESNSTFCSRFVATSYESIGVKLVKNPDYCLPSDFLNSPELTLVKDATIVAESAAVKTVVKRQSERSDISLLTSLLEKSSKLYGTNIQTSGQLLIQILKQPEKDEKFIAIIENMSFFDYRKHLLDLSPWLSSYESYCEHYQRTEDMLFHLLNSINHFDKTFSRIFRQNVAIIDFYLIMYPKSKAIKTLSEGNHKLLRQASDFNDLYKEFLERIYKEREEDCMQFVQKYVLTTD